MTPSESHVSKRTAYIYSKEYAEITSLLPSNIDRSKKVHALIEAYGLFKHPDLTIVSPRRATVKELCRYHSRDFIENNNSSDDDDDISDAGDRQKALEDRLEEYGLQYDCTVFEGIAQYAEFIAGSTIKAATLLNDDAFDVVIHWDGGRHHAKKDMSAGFCIVNDIVLGIMELQKVYNKIMYIDLDVHHGDGVENAFQFTDKVLTVSLHHFAEGFYPGTGSGVSASPRTKAVVNVPLRSGLSESNLLRIFDEMIEPLFKTYSADAVVLQCGVDGMTGDPLGKWNLSMNSYGECLKKIMAWKKPVMILGGGGYKTSSAARCYAYLTNLVLGSEISEEIPEHDYFEDYEPDFMLQLDVGRQTDENTDAYIEEVGRIVETQSKDL
ncbi:Histone deacetylase 8 [Haplosporangium sp. Z 27]|nr:Histone deacetylase 8 [Haplosporangium sp. Z 27]